MVVGTFPASSASSPIESSRTCRPTAEENDEDARRRFFGGELDAVVPAAVAAATQPRCSSFLYSISNRVCSYDGGITRVRSETTTTTDSCTERDSPLFCSYHTVRTTHFRSLAFVPLSGSLSCPLFCASSFVLLSMSQFPCDRCSTGLRKDMWYLYSHLYATRHCVLTRFEFEMNFIFDDVVYFVQYYYY